MPWRKTKAGAREAQDHPRGRHRLHEDRHRACCRRSKRIGSPSCREACSNKGFVRAYLPRRWPGRGSDRRPVFAGFGRCASSSNRNCSLGTRNKTGPKHSPHGSHRLLPVPAAAMGMVGRASSHRRTPSALGAIAANMRSCSLAPTPLACGARHRVEYDVQPSPQPRPDRKCARNLGTTQTRVSPARASSAKSRVRQSPPNPGLSGRLTGLSPQAPPSRDPGSRG